MVKIEQFGTRQKRTCFGCGTIISFENDDIVTEGQHSFVTCPVCNKKIKANKVDRENEFNNLNDKTEIATKIKDAIDDKDWGDVNGDS